MSRFSTFDTDPISVGYDTAVIGGTMALNSFIRDFGMNGIAKSNRDTIQGNIVSTFQVCLHDYITVVSSMHIDPV